MLTRKKYIKFYKMSKNRLNMRNSNKTKTQKHDNKY